MIVLLGFLFCVWAYSVDAASVPTPTVAIPVRPLILDKSSIPATSYGSFAVRAEVTMKGEPVQSANQPPIRTTVDGRPVEMRLTSTSTLPGSGRVPALNRHVYEGTFTIPAYYIWERAHECGFRIRHAVSYQTVFVKDPGQAGPKVDALQVSSVREMPGTPGGAFFFKTAYDEPILRFESSIGTLLLPPQPVKDIITLYNFYNDDVSVSKIELDCNGQSCPENIAQYGLPSEPLRCSDSLSVWFFCPAVNDTKLKLTFHTSRGVIMLPISYCGFAGGA